LRPAPQELVQVALEHKAEYAAVVRTDQIRSVPESRKACGLDVINLEKVAGIPYYHGPKAMSYVGLILFDTGQEAA